MLPLIGMLCSYWLFLCASVPLSADEPPSSVRPAQAANGALPTPTPTLAEVRYGEHERHVLDFWQAKSTTLTPLVLVVHGGGWQSGTKERVGRFANVRQLLDAGISVAAINYRLISHANAAKIQPPVKAPLHDAARALQFIRSQAEPWQIDRNRIGAAGGSAGACSSLWLAFHDDLAEPQGSDTVGRESTRLLCAAVIGAQTSLDPLQMKQWTPNSRYGAHAFGITGDRDKKISAFEQFLQDREKILPWIEEYSPYALVTADDPPVGLFYSAKPAVGKAQKDPTHTANFGVKLQQRCDEVGVACDLIYPGAPNTKYKSPTEYLIHQLQTNSP